MAMKVLPGGGNRREAAEKRERIRGYLRSASLDQLDTLLWFVDRWERERSGQYREDLRVATDHNFFCFEYHRRKMEQRAAKKEGIYEH